LKTNDEIAEEVLEGKWGEGAEREKKLTAAGYSFRRINALAADKMKLYLQTGYRFYTVKSGEDLKTIASKFEISLPKLIALNNITKPIRTGQKLRIK
jgi:hypothetical protein